MKFLKALVVIALLSMVAMPAMAELTDYQKGWMDGVKAGMWMGRLLGAAPYDPAAAGNYNNLVDSFNQGLVTIFENNQTAINMFWLQPYGSVQGINYGAQNVSFKPIHAIDSSFNQSRTINPDLESQGNYYGYDLDSYIAMTGHVPDNLPTISGSGTSDTYGNLGGI
ncbi:MAG: hypothetical protein WB392_11585 [Methanotrichaceae archaeon]